MVTSSGSLGLPAGCEYSSVVAYLRALEALPWRIHWQQVELTAGDYPVNRVRIVIGALSLSRDWMSV